MSYLYVEWKKNQNMVMILICLSFLFFCTMLGLSLYFSNIDLMDKEHQVVLLWGQLSFYYSQLFFPIMISIIVAMSLEQEFQRNNLQMLLSNNISIYKLIVAKTLHLLCILSLPQVILLFIFYLVIVINNMTITLLEVKQYASWIAFSLVSIVSMTSLQLAMMAKLRSFTRSVGIAMIGSFIGFIIIFISDKLSMLYPYSQGMVSLRARQLTNFTYLELFIFLVINSVIILISYYSAIKNLKSSDKL